MQPTGYARAAVKPDVVVWGMLGALGCAALAPLEPNLLEEGLALHVAQRLAHGERLYRDVVAAPLASSPTWRAT